MNLLVDGAYRRKTELTLNYIVIYCAFPLGNIMGSVYNICGAPGNYNYYTIYRTICLRSQPKYYITTKTPSGVVYIDMYIL